ncbi:6-carboxytetrahydropterin synthase [uncultured Rikenella sp.]|uniref:6-pyruvoyl trahydropterin synthase family protein n=1 Tax=uncultured Rikenella sp. TaxID=368003 RepID=UPI0026381BB2|nr:6-carboxytetrahydropterin synthase [uncultured Rikenella sp.]
MAVIRLTREFSFEMAHALEGYDGLCRHIHGHSYKLFVTVSGTPSTDPSSSRYGMVMDFGDLKQIVNELIVDRYDHALVLRQTPENAGLLERVREKWERVYLVDSQPTCEQMIDQFARQIASALPEGVQLAELKLYETEKSHATWRAEDNIPL